MASVLIGISCQNANIARTLAYGCIGAPVLAADDGELGMGKLFEAWPTTMASPPSSSRGDPG